jgi:hypothetical protein
MISCINTLARTAPAALSTEAHSSRSARYAHVNTSDIVGVLEQDGWSLDRSEQARTRTEDRANHAKHLLRFSHPTLPLVSGVRPQVVVLNSSDGSSALKMFAGLLRMACMNGIITGESFASMSLHHRGANIADQIVAHAATLKSRIPEVIDVIEQWRSTELDFGTQVEFAAAAAELRFPNAKIVTGAGEMPSRLNCPAAEGLPDRVVNAQSLLGCHRWSDNENNLWHVFNRVQENLIRGGAQTATLVKNDAGDPVGYSWAKGRKVTSLTANQSINQGLWDLSSQVAVALN